MASWGLQEGPAQESRVVVFAVSVGDLPVPVLRRRMLYVLQIALYQRQHVLGDRLVEHPPVAAAGDVYGRGVREHAPAPDVVVRESVVSRPAAARGQPGVAIDPNALPYLQPARAAAGIGGRNHPARLHQFQSVYRKDALGRNLNIHRAGAGDPSRCRRSPCRPP